MCFLFFFKQKTAYEMRISDWSSDVCSSDLIEQRTFDTQAEELEYLARLISQQIEGGKTPDQIAVLTRTNKEATTIALSLAAAGIACYHPDNDVLSFREVRALIAWTRVALDENDLLALVLAMSPPDGGLKADEHGRE